MNQPRAAWAALTIGVLLFLAAVPCRPSWGKDQSPPEPIEAGRRALSDHARYPWYDREADDIYEIQPPSSVATDENRASRWNSEPTSIGFWQWFWSLFKWRGNMPQLGWVGTFFRALAYVLIGALLIGLAYLLIRAYL